jgi:DNA (cytosine-5)-methyltransferase 1
MASSRSERHGFGLATARSTLADFQEPADLPERAARALLEEGLGSGRSAGSIQVVDLFSGCGGLSAGFELVGRRFGGYRLVTAAEMDPHANRTYAANLGVEPLEVDLAEAASSPAALAAFRESLQLSPDLPLAVVGGPPCQGFSAHRKRVSHSRDPRNSLVRAFAVIAASLEPDLVVMENVPEVLAKRHWGHFAAFRSVLEDRGYEITADVHNLAGFGVPQERFRAVAIAARSPIASFRPFLEPGDFRTVRDAIGHLPPVPAGQVWEGDPMHVSTRHRESTLEVIRQVPRDGGRRPAGVGPACLERVDGFRDVYCRLYWNRPANTITGYARNPASGRFIHPRQDRGLTIREAALLQGFPAHFTFQGPFDDKFSQIGNAVPPVFAAYLAAHLLQQCAGASGISEEQVPLVPRSNSFSSGIPHRKAGVPA